VSDFGDEARRAVYEVIARRRDIRHFRAAVPVADEVLHRILGAAHQAPSVGYSQPWDFVVVRDLDRRRRIRDSFLQVRAAEAARFPAGPRREQYLAYKLEGILDAALNLCVTVDLRPADEATLGTTAQPESLRWSACCAVQNLWLAARAEEVGVGWVSIVEPAVLRRELGLPPGIEPVAYLCVGYPVEFRDRPLLEETGWRARRPVEAAIHDERYRVPLAPPPPTASTSLAAPPPAAALPPNDAATPDAAPTRNRASPAPSHIVAIPAFDDAAAEAARAHQDRLCKPRRSLGRLEDLAAWYAGARGQFPLRPPARIELYVFAADHGVVEEGVSAWSSSVTAAMVGNFLAGGAAVCQLARGAGVALTVVDAGVAGDLSALPQPADRRARYVAAKVRAGTGNLARTVAMERPEAEAALALGRRLAAAAAAAGCDLLCAGEMGIGNTTAASALLCALAGVVPADAVGRGAGLDDAAVAHKVDVVRCALERHRPRPADPLGTLAAVGGLEIAAMAGLMLGGAAARVPVVVDGFIAGAAALVAVALAPEVRPYLLLSHRSAERGAARLAAALGLEPLLDLGLRLGEGSGAILAAELVRHAVRLQADMATFSTAGVPDRVGGDGATS
jgi:nicotinate-nucleotide--dimethylbenzimidazole phosphoribosyltransferase